MIFFELDSDLAGACDERCCCSKKNILDLRLVLNSLLNTSFCFITIFFIYCCPLLLANIFVSTEIAINRSRKKKSDSTRRSHYDHL